MHFFFRVRLSKRRQKAGQQANNTRLVVRHRPLNAQEYKMQRYREKQLEPPNEEEEDEEEDEEEEQDGALDTVEQNKSGKRFYLFISPLAYINYRLINCS